MRRYQAYLFDYDDTLVLTREVKFRAIRATAQQFYQTTLSDEEIAAHWGKPFHALFSELFANFNPDVDQVIEQFLSITHEYPVVAFPTAVETLNELSKRAFVGIVTSASRRVVLPDLDRLGFRAENYRLIQCSEDTHAHKPDPAVFSPALLALRNSHIEPSEVVYIGDAVSDRLASQGVGFNFIGFVNKLAKMNPFLDTNVPYIHEMKELLVT